MKTLTLSLTLLLCFAVSVQAQINNSKQIEALQQMLSNATNDEAKMQYNYELSVEYSKIDFFDKSEEYAEKLFALANKTNYDRGICLYHSQMAELYFRQGRFKESKGHGILAYGGFLRRGKPMFYMKCKYFYGMACLSLGELSEALNAANDGLKYGGETEFYQEKGLLYSMKAHAFISMENYSEALKYLQKGMEEFSMAKSEVGPSICYSYMLEIYTKTKDWPNAKKYGLLYLGGLKNPLIYTSTNYQMALGTLGKIEAQLGNHAVALNYFRKSLAMGEKENISGDRLETYKAMAETLFSLKKYDEAIEKAEFILKDTSIEIDDDSRVKLYSLIRNSHLKLKNHERAGHYGDMASKILGRKVSGEIVNASERADNYKSMATAEFASGNYKQAYQYQEKYAELSRYQMLNEKETRVNELQAKFELTDKDLQLKDLTINKQKNELKMASQKNTLLVTIAVLAVIFLISLFLYWRYRLNKKSNLILRDKNHEIEMSLNEKNILLKEIHHRVKNNLQLIISLLNIQARENNHMEVDAFLEKGRGRIISMALIHQNLYEADNLAKVNFQEYLENLINSNAETYGLADMNNVSFTINAKEMYFDVQTSIPLGLIINELFCNAMKHAFSADRQGVIDIAINKKQSGEFELLFSDNGTGMDNSKKSGKTFGTELVKLLAMQLRGEVMVDTQSGTAYNISFEDIAA